MALTLKSIRKAWQALTTSEPETIAAEAVNPALYQLTAGDGENATFRRITSQPNLRDLNPIMHERMQQVAYYLSVTTPFGKRIVEIITSYTVGKGVRVTCADPKAQEVVDKFWKDDINKMDAQLPIWCDELTRFGELCLPFARRTTDGFVRLGYVDPMNVDSIVFGQMVTANGTAAVSIPYGVQLRKEAGEQSPRVMPIVRRSEDISDPAFGLLTGECFYHSINKAKSASRGISELFSLSDWIDVFDQMMFDFADKVRMLNQWVWHYQLEGADDAKVKKFRDDLSKAPPKQGGLLVTNEKVKADPKTPDFKGADMAAAAGMVKRYGLGGVGLPAIFFADGDDANRAAALEMNAPAAKKFQDRQNNLGVLLQDILAFVIDSAVQAGVLPESVDRKVTIEFPEIVIRDLAKGAQAITAVSTALVTAQEEGWITGQTAARTFHTLLAEVGVDIDDSQEEYQAAQEERTARDRERQNNYNPQSNLSAAMKALQSGDNDAPEPSEDDDTPALQDAA